MFVSAIFLPGVNLCTFWLKSTQCVPNVNFADLFGSTVSLTLMIMMKNPAFLAQACGVPVGPRSGGWLATTLVATINVIIFHIATFGSILDTQLS